MAVHNSPNASPGSRTPSPEPRAPNPRLPAEAVSKTQSVLNSSQEDDFDFSREEDTPDVEPLSGRTRLPWTRTTPDEMKTGPITNPRQWFERCGVDESHFSMFLDGRALHGDEKETLVSILYRIPDISPERDGRWTQKGVAWKQLSDRPDMHRARLFRVIGRVQGIERVELIPEQVSRFLYDHYWRIQFELDDGPYPIVVCARIIPNEWKKVFRAGEPIDERASFTGLFLKTGDESGDAPELVFATTRVAWHPDRVDEKLGVSKDDVLLGDLGMDKGLFADAVDRRELLKQDRECFYQLLAATGKADREQLDRRGDTEYDPHAMLVDPDSHRGRLFAVTGVVRRITKLQVDDPDIRERFGIDHYYELNLFVPLEVPIQITGEEGEPPKTFANHYPIVACVRRLPEGMPEGDDVHEEIRVAGFYLKVYGYQTPYMSEENRNRLQYSPMLVALEPEWIATEPESNPYFQVLVGGLFVLALGGIWLGLWRYSRGDREFERTALSRQFEVEKGQSLNDMGLEASDGPDFSGLHEADG